MTLVKHNGGTMKKLMIISILMITSFCVEAGLVNNKMTKIRISKEGKEIKFYSKFPHLILRVKEKDFKRALISGRANGQIKIKQKKLLNEIDRQRYGKLLNKKNGFTIEVNGNKMFITDKELGDLKRDIRR